MAKDNQHRQSLELNDTIAFEEADVLPGFPGYRTRKGLSGYDYIDTQLEFAHM